MALHTQLPIYKVAYDLLDVVTDLVKNMPRDFKQSVGSKISQECVEIVVLIFRANCAREKATHLGDLIDMPQDAFIAVQELHDGIHLRMVDRRTAESFARANGGLPS